MAAIADAPAPLRTQRLRDLARIPRHPAFAGLASLFARLDEHGFPDLAALNRLADVMLPRTASHPGALDAKTPEFLDFLIGHSPTVRGSLYINGLNWLDSQARLKHNKSFAQIEAAQVDALLKPCLRTWMTDHPPTQTHADFINIAHADIRTATVNSQVWFETLDPKRQESTTQLYWSPIEPDIYAERATSVGLADQTAGDRS